MKDTKSINISGTKISISDLEFKDFPKSSNVKIYVKAIESHSDNLILLHEKIKCMIRDEYLEVLCQMYNEYNKLFDDIPPHILIKSHISTVHVNRQYVPLIFTL